MTLETSGTVRYSENQIGSQKTLCNGGKVPVSSRFRDVTKDNDIPFSKDADSFSALEDDSNFTELINCTLEIILVISRYCPRALWCTDQFCYKLSLTKMVAKPRLMWWILLLQEFNVIIRDEKGVENLAADYLSRLENPHQDKLESKEITETFSRNSWIGCLLRFGALVHLSDRGNIIFANDSFQRSCLIMESIIVSPIVSPLTSGQVEDVSDFEASRFCPSSTRASKSSASFGNPISKSYRLTVYL
ncbi:hypothetical protein Tco_0127999 [Tanacetum coccineum]